MGSLLVICIELGSKGDVPNKPIYFCNTLDIEVLGFLGTSPRFSLAFPLAEKRPLNLFSIQQEQSILFQRKKNEDLFINPR